MIGDEKGVLEKHALDFTIYHSDSVNPDNFLHITVMQETFNLSGGTASEYPQDCLNRHRRKPASVNPVCH